MSRAEVNAAREASYLAEERAYKAKKEWRRLQREADKAADTHWEAVCEDIIENRLTRSK